MTATQPGTVPPLVWVNLANGGNAIPIETETCPIVAILLNAIKIHFSNQLSQFDWNQLSLHRDSTSEPYSYDIPLERIFEVDNPPGLTFAFPLIVKVPEGMSHKLLVHLIEKDSHQEEDSEETAEDSGAIVEFLKYHWPALAFSLLGITLISVLAILFREEGITKSEAFAIVSSVVLTVVGFLLQWAFEKSRRGSKKVK